MAGRGGSLNRDVRGHEGHIATSRASQSTVERCRCLVRAQEEQGASPGAASGDRARAPIKHACRPRKGSLAALTDEAS